MNLLLLAAADAKSAFDLLELLHIDKAYFTLGMVLVIFLLLALTSLAPDVILIGSVVILLALGVLSPSQALAGMSNEALITVAVLYIVGAGIQETGGVAWVATRLFGRPKTVLGAVSRLTFPTMGLSAFMNNTPLVAMLIPAVGDLARSNRIPVSKLMIPLSYAAILGGTCTLIGTSTNMVVQGKLVETEQRQEKMLADGKKLAVGEQQIHRLRMFDITWVGLPAAVIGGTYLVFAAKYLLPDRKPAVSTQDDPREYTVEMQVEAASPMIGKSIEVAGLRHLPGLFLAEIDREGVSIPAVSPQEVLHSGDRLLFVGAVESVKELHKLRGLVPATEDVFKLKAPRPQRCLIEAVVSNTCPFVGMTIRDSRFRNHYNAVVVAVARNGQRLQQKIGDIVLRPGDVLLVEAHPSFADQQRASRDFFLVSKVEDSHPPRHDRALFSVFLLLAMVIVVQILNISMLIPAMIVGGLMIATRCLSIESARKSVDWEVILAIAASIALGSALESTGAAKMIAELAISTAGGSPWMTLAIIYFVTLVVTELITNNAAAALMLPFSLATAQSLEVSYLPFVIAVMMAASAGFATPIGYQTNLMVYGPGGYKFTDYLKIGVPLDLLIMAVTVVLTPLAFPFK